MVANYRFVAYFSQKIDTCRPNSGVVMGGTGGMTCPPHRESMPPPYEI